MKEEIAICHLLFVTAIAYVICVKWVKEKEEIGRLGGKALGRKVYFIMKLEPDQLFFSQVPIFFHVRVTIF